MSDKFSINLTSCLDGNKLKINQEMLGQIQSKIIDFEEKSIKDALLELGWTPPVEQLKGSEG